MTSAIAKCGIKSIKYLCYRFAPAVYILVSSLKMSFDEEPPPDARLGPAPAPLDLGRLEVEARAAAAKHVASLLQVMTGFKRALKTLLF